jgi:hypothetical protein
MVGMSTITTASAALSDEAAMNSLLEPIPDADRLRALLSSGNFGRDQEFDPKTKKA